MKALRLTLAATAFAAALAACDTARLTAPSAVRRAESPLSSTTLPDSTQVTKTDSPTMGSGG